MFGRRGGGGGRSLEVVVWWEVMVGCVLPITHPYVDNELAPWRREAYLPKTA